MGLPSTPAAALSALTALGQVASPIAEACGTTLGLAGVQLAVSALNRALKAANAIQVGE